jgi:hypothetical protein
VLVYSEQQVEERKDWCTSPVYWALREGRVLYAGWQGEARRIGSGAKAIGLFERSPVRGWN